MNRKLYRPILLSLAATVLCLPANTWATAADDGQSSRFASLAWASGYMNYAISANLPSREAAEEKALAACRAQVAQGCMTAATSENGVIVLAAADDGGRVAFAEATEALAVDTALHQCRKKGLRCTYVDSSANVPKNQTIRVGEHTKPTPDLWGTFAYREDGFPERVHRIWAVSAKPTQDEAVQAALELCQREEKATCVAKAGARNGYVAAYSFGFEQGTPFIESDVSDTLLKQAIDARCKYSVQSFCLTHLMFDARAPVEPKHEVNFVPLAPRSTPPSNPSR
jgi:Domain of unknown function (DUF4189)